MSFRAADEGQAGSRIRVATGRHGCLEPKGSDDPSDLNAIAYGAAMRDDRHAVDLRMPVQDNRKSASGAEMDVACHDELAPPHLAMVDCKGRTSGLHRRCKDESENRNRPPHHHYPFQDGGRNRVRGLRQAGLFWHPSWREGAHLVGRARLDEAPLAAVSRGLAAKGTPVLRGGEEVRPSVCASTIPPSVSPRVARDADPIGLWIQHLVERPRYYDRALAAFCPTHAKRHSASRPLHKHLFFFCYLWSAPRWSRLRRTLRLPIRRIRDALFRTLPRAFRRASQAEPAMYPHLPRPS